MDACRGRYRGGGRRSQRSTGKWIAIDAVEARRHLDYATLGSGSSEVGNINSEEASADGITKKFNTLLSENPNDPNSESLESHSVLPNDGSFKEVRGGKTAYEGTSGKKKPDSSDSQHNEGSFDICKERDGKLVTLKTSLHIKNKALRNEKRRMQGDNINILGPGMILLKGYLPLVDQVKLVKSCRDLGRGPGGFYQPGYHDGAKLHLKMMCLGKNWDPEARKYDDMRPFDQAKPPPIPIEFQRLVKEAIQDCNHYLESDRVVMNSRKFLPPMSPNICIINYYTSTGKLGLHQDKDESQESILKGLPVVSFSLGDAAEFLFGDNADVDKARKVKLESGDVLIFGGESRLIFHGVSKIIASTTPQALLEETSLKPGRLNLTFREY